MVGSGASDRSKEAVGMMALHESLKRVCLNSDWTYSVFWTIRPRPYAMPCHASHFFSFSLFFCLQSSTGSSPFLAGEFEVVMAARLEMTTVACKHTNHINRINHIPLSLSLSLHVCVNLRFGGCVFKDADVGRWFLPRKC